MRKYIIALTAFLCASTAGAVPYSKTTNDVVIGTATQVLAGDFKVYTSTLADASNPVIQLLGTQGGSGIFNGVLTASGTFQAVGSLGTIATTSSGNQITMSRAGANYITATNASGTLSLGANGSTNLIDLSSTEALINTPMRVLGQIEGSLVGDAFETDVANAGGTQRMRISNSDNTNTTSHANLTLQTGGASGGDPFILFGNSVVNWTAGVDNSDGDKFKIANSLALGTNDRFTIDSIGNVGIGTTDPIAPNGGVKVLVTSGTTAEIAVEGTSTGGHSLYAWSAVSSGGIKQQYYAGMNILDQTTGWSLYDKTQNANRIFVSTSGRVGIGTSSPQAGLDVSWANLSAVFGSDDNAQTRTNNTQKVARIGSYPYTNSTLKHTMMMAVNSLTSADLNIGGGSGAMNAVTDVVFYTAVTTDTLAGTERVRINPDGNVGIGTSSPNSKLTVLDGDIRISTTTGSRGIIFQDGSSMVTAATGGGNISGSLTSGKIPKASGTNSIADSVIAEDSGKIGIGTTTANAMLRVLNSSANSGLRVDQNASGENSAQFISLNSAGVSQGVFIRAGTNSSDDSLLIEDAGGSNTYFNVRGDGNVGIGTSSPGAALDVKGASSGVNAFLRNSTGDTANYQAFVDISGNQWNVGNFDTSKMAIYQEGTVPGTGSGILFSGVNTGIGTASPVDKLHVVGATQIEGTLRVNAGVNPQIQMQESGTNRAFLTYYAASGLTTLSRTGATNTTGLTVDSSDNVGVGVDPEAKFHVQGGNALFRNDVPLHVDIDGTTVGGHKNNDLRFGINGTPWWAAGIDVSQLNQSAFELRDVQNSSTKIFISTGPSTKVSFPSGASVGSSGLTFSDGSVQTTAAGQTTVTKYTVGFASLSAASTNNDIELFSLPARGMVKSVTIKPTTAFSGGGITAYTISVGTGTLAGGTLTRYASSFDVFQAVSDTTFQTSVGAFIENFGAATSVRVAATSTGANLNAAGAGSVDIYVETLTLP